MTEFIKGDFDIAVIGMACRFPFADDISHFRDNIFSGRDCITRNAGASDENYISAYGKLENIYDFDNSFFGIKKEEACMSDPQQRIFLETVYSALADAGCTGNALTTGIFGGSDEFAYVWKRICRSSNSEEAFEKRSLLLSGSLTSYISYRLDLRGPSITMRTACSTSLTAVHYAMLSLLNYECDVCIAGGAAVTEEQEGYRISENTLSADGYTRSFSSKGTGFVPGSGAGAVVLKRLEDAIEDNDRIYAVIRGSAVTNDGSTKAGYTAPSIKGISSALKNAYVNSGISPDDVGYVECHGTGTVIGDAVEIQALDRIFSPERTSKCRVGSVKSNIGHTNMASGIASLIKAVFMVREGVFAPTLYCDEENACIGASKHIILSKERENWTAERRIAGVTAFGIGGTNCHVIVENYDAPEHHARKEYGISCVSADSISQLEHNEKTCVEFLSSEKDISFGDVMYSTMMREKSRRFRAFAVPGRGEGMCFSAPVDTDECDFEEIVFRVNDLEDASPEKIRELREVYPPFGEYYDEVYSSLTLPEENELYRKYAANISFCSAYLRCAGELVSGAGYSADTASGTELLPEKIKTESSVLEKYHEHYQQRNASYKEYDEEYFVTDITPGTESYVSSLLRTAGELWSHGCCEGGGIIDELTADASFVPVPFGFANKEYCYDEV